MNSGRRFFRGFAWWCLLGCMLLGLALGEPEVEWTVEEWSLTADGLTTFQGTILPDADVSEASLVLSVESNLAEPGEAVFTSLGGEKLKIRKRTPEAAVSLQTGVSLDFEGQWQLPDDQAEEVTFVTLRLEVKDGEGKTLTSASVSFGEQQTTSQAATASTPEIWMNRAIWGLAILCVLVWSLAILRSVRNRRGKV